jgi:hypothetical protein
VISLLTNMGRFYEHLSCGTAIHERLGDRKSGDRDK